MQSVLRNGVVKLETDLRVNQVYYMDIKRQDFSLHDA